MVECCGSKALDGDRRFVITAPDAVALGGSVTRFEVLVDGRGALSPLEIGATLDIPHEEYETHRMYHTFRVRAVNANGPGPWSEPGEPRRHTGKAKVKGFALASRVRGVVRCIGALAPGQGPWCGCLN
jgi:hypothetical protein